MKIVRIVHGDAHQDALRQWPWYALAYREFDRYAFVYAPVGIHLLLRAWRYRNRIVFGPLCALHVWYVELGGLYTSGRFVWPWSRCWVERINKAVSDAREEGIREGRRQRREEEQSFFDKYMADLKAEREEHYKQLEAEKEEDDVRKR